MTIDKDRFLFGAVVGSGMTAQVANRAGAEYFLALNAGRFRVQGASSLACFLPVRNTNEWVFEFAEREILGRVSAPVFAGLSVADPHVDLDRLVKQVQDLGFDGICNFPSNALVSGRIQKLLEEEGLGYTREIELVSRARKIGLDALVYVTTKAQSQNMYNAGATTLCVNMGFTGVATEMSLATAAHEIDQVLEGLPSSLPTLCAGGPIVSPEDAMAVWRTSKVQGYIAGSTLDRLPIEQTLEEVANGFRVISKLSRGHLGHDDKRGRLIGSSSQIQALNRDIEDLAKDDAPVLILGETGTGKTKTAQLLHQLSDRKNQRMSVIDCPGLELETGRILLMGTTAGTVKTGLAGSRGALEAAARGTVLFDGLDALRPEHQGQILRFSEDGTVQRLGDPDTRVVSARIIATADPALLADVAADRFRSDLYYRLAVHELHIPPLRDHLEDLPELVDFIVTKLTRSDEVQFTNAALKEMMDYSWPGNIRELKNVVSRAIRKAKKNKIARDDLVFSEFAVPPNPLKNTVQPADNISSPQTERDWILSALKQHGWRRSEAAAELGMSTRTLFNKIKKYGFDA